LFGVNGEDGFIKETRASKCDLIHAINGLSKSAADHIADPIRGGRSSAP
jgi:hypothetical protein